MINYVTLEQAEKIMQEEFSENAISTWEVTMIHENAFQFTRKTQFIKTTGICTCYFSCGTNNIFDYDIAEIVLLRYK